jgi:hypothetical protein
MKHTWLGVLLACVLANNAFATVIVKGSITATETGKFEPVEKRVIPLAFMAAVYNWLKKQDPELLSRDDYHVKMHVNYDYSFEIDLTVNADSYDVKVSLGVSRMTKTDAESIQRHAAKIAHGVRAHMEDELERSARVK